jgi:threonyl-tRNA synthetase
MLVVGEQEELENSVSVRKQGDGDKGKVSLDEFVKMVNKEITDALDIN